MHFERTKLENRYLFCSFSVFNVVLSVLNAQSTIYYVPLLPALSAFYVLHGYLLLSFYCLCHYLLSSL